MIFNFDSRRRRCETVPHQPRGVRGHGRPVRQQPRARADGARQPVRRGRAVHGLHEVGPGQRHVSRGVTRQLSRVTWIWWSGCCRPSPPRADSPPPASRRTCRPPRESWRTCRLQHRYITDIHLLLISNICTVSTHTGCEISVRSVQTLPVS